MKGVNGHTCPKLSLPPRCEQIDTTMIYHGAPQLKYACAGPKGANSDPDSGNWHLYTDGSGGDSETWDPTAGWGVAVYATPPTSMDDQPCVRLYGPVMEDKWDNEFLGATGQSNSTAELTAIGEACLWLLHETDELEKTPAVIYYDSEYAAKTAQREWKPQDNIGLVETIADLVEKTRKQRELTFK